MKVRNFKIQGPLLIEPKRIYDICGFSSEIYNADRLHEHGLADRFQQDMLHLHTASGTVRGMYFQPPPYAQELLLRVVRGAVLAVAIDMREGSPSYGKHVSAELTSENALQLHVPTGFAYGYATTRPLTEITLKSSLPSLPDYEKGIYWDDPALRIAWPVSADEATLCPQDKKLPLLKEIVTPFQLKPVASNAA